MLQNKVAERAVLSGLCRHGIDAYIEIADLLDVNCFVDNKNQLIYRVLENIFASDRKTVDIPSINSEAQSLGFYDRICKEKIDQEYIRSLFNYPIEFQNVRPQSQVLAKLNIARKTHESHQKAAKQLAEISGSESIDEIIKVSESPFLELIGSINNETSVSKIGEDIDDYIDYLEENEGNSVGIYTPFPIFNHVVGDGLRPGVHLIGARLKALRYGSLVYTPSGPVKIENIKIGDKVIHPFKGETSVTETHDHKNIQLYRITFRDNDFVDCCEDHLWEVTNRHSKKTEVLSTKEIIEKGFYKNQECLFDVRLPNPTEFLKQEVEIKPYTLGVLLGDGSFCNKRTVVFTSMDQEIVDFVKEDYGDRVKFDWKSENKKNTDYRINGLKKIVEKMGLWGIKSIDKGIPDNYKYNSINVRLDVLRGLMDTDGTCVLDKRSNNTRCKFYSSSYKLASDVKEIVESLGGLCSLNKYISKCNGKEFTAYFCEVRLPLFNPFRLSRKANKVKPRVLGDLKRSIRNIEPICIENARCLTLEENDGLFMTNNFIVTHNTGKMQPYSAKVYTPSGFKTMGEIEIADNVLSPLGGYAKVVDITENGEQDVYRMIFSDGSSMECGLEHMVEYTTRKGKYFKVTELKNLINDLKTDDGHYKYEIRLTKPLNFEKKSLVITPYMMGLMLGNKDLFESDETGKLLFYDLEKWEDRHIPQDYLHSSFEDREKLYQGLMDSYGDTTGKHKKFYCDHERLNLDFIYLARSLGAYTRVMNYKEKFIKVNIERRTKTLQKVEFVRKENCKCIKLSTDDGLYITDDFTVTHNSTIGKEVAYHAANKGIPSLYIDTEMQKEDQLNRMLSSITKINIRSIEKGWFKKNEIDRQKVLDASSTIKKIPFYHKNVSGREFSYVLSIMKRWIHKEVGFESDGSVKPHLIIYDYFKLMDTKSLKDAAEYQLMGFQIAALHDFCMKYRTPVLSFVQLNRDGITKDSTDVISQSDRLGWNAVSLSIFRRKTADEIAADGIQNGNARLVPLEGRYMDKLDDGDYINFHIDGATATIKEISRRNSPKTNTGFEIDNTSQQEIEFGNGTDFDKIGDIEL